MTASGASACCESGYEILFTSARSHCAVAPRGGRTIAFRGLLQAAVAPRWTPTRVSRSSPISIRESRGGIARSASGELSSGIGTGSVHTRGRLRIANRVDRVGLGLRRQRIRWAVVAFGIVLRVVPRIAPRRDAAYRRCRGDARDRLSGTPHLRADPKRTRSGSWIERASSAAGTFAAVTSS